jgi:tRNA threonylcarbamoyladenosine modification (KEOPS) complex  Pcc1 subunit
MKAEIDIPCKNPDNVLKAIEPDMEGTVRFNASIKPSKGKLLVTVESADIAGLLTGVNSYLKLIRTVTEVEKIG